MDEKLVKRSAPCTLSDWEKKWYDAIGQWQPGVTATLRGKDIFTDFADETWMGYLLFAMTGRQFNEAQVKLFDSMWRISSSYPDPRLWNNRIAALAATARSTVSLGLAGAIATSESIAYGTQPQLASYNFLQSARRHLDKGLSLRSFLENAMQRKTRGRPGSGKLRSVAKIPGFGRPIVNGDERLKPLLEMVDQLGFSDGEYLRLAHSIEAELVAMASPLRMNNATLWAALCADHGLGASGCYYFTCLCFNAGFIACAKDALDKPEGAFFPLRCEHIHYEGPPERRWRVV